jgi:hypothetical protein
MLIPGVWLLCPDGIVRPVLRGEVEAADGSWVKAPFLLDTGADRTVFSANILAALGLQSFMPSQKLAGAGGERSSVLVDTRIQFCTEDGNRVVFRAQYAAVTELEALDMSALGRDITNLFAVIVDRPRDLVGLLSQRHQYTIEQT